MKVDPECCRPGSGAVSWSMGLMQTVLRRPHADESPAMRHIWETVFGGSEEKEAFFCHYYDPKLCCAVMHGGRFAAAGHCFPVGGLVCGEQFFSCSMIYAVATVPEQRGRGYGTAIVNNLINTANSTADCAVVLCPAEDSLFEYYGVRTKMRDFFYVKERKFDIIPQGAGEAEPAEITAEQYKRLRTDLLSGVVHIDMDIHALSYQSLLCGIFGGCLVKIETRDGTACAAIERQPDGAVWIKELLTPGGCDLPILSSIARMFPGAAEYVVRTPAPRSPDASVRRFGMLAATFDTPDILDSAAFKPWLGLAFD